MQIVGIYQLGSFVCFSQGGELAARHFDPRTAVPDSCTEWPSLRSEAGRPSIVLSGLQAMLDGWGRVVTTLLHPASPPTLLPSPKFKPISFNLPSSLLPLYFGPLLLLLFFTRRATQRWRKWDNFPLCFQYCCKNRKVVSDNLHAVWSTHSLLSNCPDDVTGKVWGQLLSGVR